MAANFWFQFRGDARVCRTFDAVASKAHAGCDLARGGQRVEVITVLPTCAELRVWSSNGAESTIVTLGGRMLSGCRRLSDQRPASRSSPERRSTKATVAHLGSFRSLRRDLPMAS